jgi:hypothetical protein
MRDDRAAKIDGCPHDDFDAPTGQCRQCGAHYKEIIQRYRDNLLAAYAAVDAAAVSIADAERELADVQVLLARLITPP